MATQTEVPAVRSPEAAGSRAATSAARRLDIAVVAVPAGVALILCLIEATTRSLWLDEAATVAIAGQHGSAFWHAAAHDGGNMLGYYALLHVLIGWFGHGAFVIRLPSVVAAACAAGAVGLFGLRLFDRRVALAAGLLTAVSLPLVFWGQNARGYAAMVALVAGSFVAFAALVDGPRRRGPWIAYVALTALSAYASYVAIFALPAQLIALAVCRRDAWRRAVTAIAACAVCWIPLIVLALSRGSGQLFWIGRPNFKLERQVVQALTSAGFEPNFHPVAVATPLAILTVALLAFAAVRAVRRPRWGPVLALSWLVAPVALMWLWSFIGHPIFTPRNLLVSLPAVAVLLGWVIMSSRAASTVAWLAVAALIALRLIVLVPAYGTSPENWRAATAYVLASSRPGDCVAFYPLDASMPFDYYAGRPVQPHVEQYVKPTVPSGCPRVWLVASHQGLPSGTAASRAHYSRYVSVREALAREYPRRRVRAFGYASVIWVELFSR
ncbi:MAG TPA: glycosyltransferase family 39 protein [Solirubrobacteraceae bacterium]|nr:glycosyltransferase family 39 protein [Solirubrobacteraceae bacterium]